MPLHYGRGQIPGTLTNDSAAAGRIGEFSESNIASGSAVAIGSSSLGAATNITSLALTPGDWNVWVDAHCSIGAGTTVANFIAGLHTSSGARGGEEMFRTGVGLAGAATESVTIGPIRVSISSNTTYYYNMAASWSGGAGVSGFGALRARRAR